MKKYMNSFRLFTARYSVKVAWQSVLSILGIYVVIVLAALFIDGDLSGEFITDLTPIFSCSATFIGIILLNAIYSYNNPSMPGYKYFHSIEDCGKRFKEAVIVSNVLGLLIVFLITVLCALTGLCAGDIKSAFFPPAIGLFVLGMTNFTGYAKNIFFRLIWIFAVIFMVGFGAGFGSEADDVADIALNNIVIIVMVMVGVVMFILGFAYSVARADKKWRQTD